MKHPGKFLSSDLMADQKIVRDSLFQTCVLIGNDVYAFTTFKRLLIKWNLKTKEMTLLENLKDYDAQFVADDMLNVGNKIYALELNGNRLLECDVEEKVCLYYDIGCHKEAWGNYAAFAQWKEKLYIFPKYKDEIVKFEIQSGEIKKSSISYSEFDIDEIKRHPSKEDMFFKYGFQDRNVVWLFRKQSNLALAYDLEQGIWRMQKLTEKINDCVHAVQYKGYIYILSLEGKVYCWDKTNNFIRTLVDYSEEKMEGTIFARIAVTDCRVFLFPAEGENIFYIDLKKGQVEKFMAYPPDFKYCGPDGWSKYYGYCEDDDFYYFAMRSMNYVPCVSKKKGNIEWIKLEVPTSKEYVWNYIKSNKRLMDERECKVPDIVEYLKNCSENSQEQDCTLVGEQIFRRLR